MLNYLEQKNFFWRVYESHSFGQAEIALYFHLLEICDKCSWTNPFKRQNTKICAHLNMSKKTLEKTRNRLRQGALIDFDGLGKGSTNIRYELKKAINYSSKHSSNDPTSDPSDGNINKEEDYTKIEVVGYAAVFDFFLETKNFRLLQKNFSADREQKLKDYFKEFYDSKVDLGEFKNKTKEDIVTHFARWLPKYLVIESYNPEGHQPKSKKKDAVPEGESKVSAAQRRHEEFIKQN